jgi:hypothetical protein
MKIPYEILAVEVERLYSIEFPDGADKQIEEHCEKIAALITGAGWDEEEYINRWFSERKSN